MSLATPMSYQGKRVIPLRDARAGDAHYDKAKDQVVVRNDDESVQVVLRSDLKPYSDVDQGAAPKPKAPAQQSGAGEQTSRKPQGSDTSKR